jgi:hypothetical protein
VASSAGPDSKVGAVGDSSSCRQPFKDMTNAAASTAAGLVKVRM